VIPQEETLMEITATTARTLALRLVTAAACLLAAAAPFPAQGAQSSTQSYTEATDVVAVEVPVQVIRDGEPVRGLTAANFEVWEGRKQQPLTGFETLDLTAVAAPAGQRPAAAPVIPPSARRRFVLLFDMSYSSPASLGKARQAAKGLLASGLQPSDLVSVATYSLSRGPELVLGFTSDRKQALAAIERLGFIDRAADPLRLSMPMAAGMGGGGGEEGGNARTEGRFRPDNDATSGGGNSGLGLGALTNAANDRAAFDAEQRDVSLFSKSLAAFAKVLGSVHGRKYVVFLSEGFQNRILLGTDDDAEIQAMNEASAAGHSWLVNSDIRYGNTKLSTDVEKMIEELRRADCVVQAVDPGGLRAYGGENGVKPASGQDSLFVMANGTGGELYNNFNDLSLAMKEMLKRTSVTYVLSYQPEGVKHDGSYRKLRVELKNVPRGARIVYRPGYYAPKPYREQSPLERMLDTAGRVVSGEQGGTIAASVLAAPFQGPGDKAYVPVLIEIDGPSLLAGHQGAALPVEIYAYALDADGAVKDFFAKTIGLDVAKVEPVLRQSGLKLYGDLELAPGSYSLRVLVRNGASGDLSARVLPLEVPAFAEPAAVLLPPFFPEPAGRWLIVRESNDAPQGMPYPFQIQSQPFVPAALPVLQSGVEARVALMGYHLRPGDLKADSRILSADGKEVGAGEIRVVGRQGGAASEPDRLAATFKAPALAPGEYLLLVTLTDASGVAETSTASFIVGTAGKGAHG
jgi:VWFA-related protein